jgi:hypothetical protein
MVKVKLEEHENVFQLHKGGYDGSTFKCGPGLPHDPPKAITIEDDQFVWRYEHSLRVSDDESTPGGYLLVKETRK